MAIDYSSREKQTKEFFEFLSQHTTMTIDLHLIKHESLFDRSKSLKFTIAQNVRLTDAFRVLKRENLYWKNDKRHENVYWSWSKSQKLNIAFVDDLIETNLFKSEGHLALIQTSKSKYQSLFLLDRYVSDEELKDIQRVLRDKYNGDVGALSPYQLKRLVGFVNTKYSDGFVVRLDFKGSRVLEVKTILSKDKNTDIKSHATYGCISYIKKTWLDFDTGDESQTDMKYALYLMGQGYTDEEVKERLLRESRDIHTRKGQYVDEYLERTIKKSREYLRMNTLRPKRVRS